MQRQFRNFAWLMLAALATLSLSVGAVAAHEGRPVRDYRFIVGWLEEPAYEGFQNAVSLRVSKVIESEDAAAMGVQQEEHGEPGHHDEDSESTSATTHEDSSEGEDHHGSEDKDKSSESAGHQGTEDSDRQEIGGRDASIAGQDEGGAVPVEGLEGSLQVEVTHVPTGRSQVFDVVAVFGDPGHYVAGLIPTASGVYEFRIIGTIEGTSIDETFASVGGGGGFDDIRPSADLQFPERLPELREVAGAAQGARDIAQQAQDAALAAQASGDEDGGVNALAVVALIIGIVGALLGAGGVFMAVQARRSP